MGLPYDQQSAIEAVLSAIYHLQSPPGPYGKRYYSLIFRDLPDRRDYPDYYLFIKEPRSLNGISESLRQGRYSSPQGVAYDMLLIWSNAREYNQQGSQVYADADTLEQHMRRTWQERSPPLPPFESLPRPGSLPVTQPPAQAPPAVESERKVKRLKLTGASLGSSSTKIRIGAPASASPAPAANTSTPGLTLKLGGRNASSNVAASTSADLPALPPLNLPHLPAQTPGPSTPMHPQLESGERESREAGERSGSAAPHKKDVKKKGKQSVDPEGDGEGEDEPSGPQMATVPDPESGWMGGDLSRNPPDIYLDILNKIRDHTDSSGRQLATPLLDLPDRATRPDYYQLVSDPVALSTIEDKIKAGAYPTPEAYDRDLFHLFETAKVFIRPDSPGTIYGDLVVLQRLYQELTKRGAELETGVTAINTGAVPGNIKREEGLAGDPELKVGRPTTRPTIKDKVLLDSINFKGDVLRVGDWIYLSNSQNPAKPIIAQIWQTYKRSDSPQRCLSVCWYYRPEETVHPAARLFYENEVFKTGIFIDHVVEEYIGRCFVMFFTRYTRGRPRAPAWTPEIPLYVCEYRYKDDVKSFKKIKSWVSCVPEQVRQHEYDLEPFADDRVDILPKVKSPFVRGVAGTAEVDNNYNFSQDGIPTAAAEENIVPEQVPMDLDARQAGESVRPFEAQVSHNAAVAASASTLGAAPDATLVDYGSTLTPAFQVPPTPAPGVELDTTDWVTPLPSALKSKFRNDAVGDLLWFGAPATSPPTIAKPTHSLAYLYWRVRKEHEAELA